MTPYLSYMTKQAGIRQTWQMADAAGGLIQELHGSARDAWPNIARAGHGIAELAGEHGPKVEKGLDVLHRLVGTTAAVEQGIDRTARGLEQGAAQTHALRELVDDARHIHGRLTQQTRPHPLLMAGVGGGSALAALAAYDALNAPVSYGAPSAPGGF